MMRRFPITVAIAALALFGASCSSDTSKAPTTTTTVSATTTAATTTSAPATHPQSTASPTHPAPHTTSPQGSVGADGSTGNNLSPEYCAKNQDPGCPLGSYIGPNAIQNPNGDGTWVPCEGSICTNPNHGAGTDPRENGSTMPNPNGDGTQVPCEGTICTNPNNGAGTDPRENGGN